LRHSMENLPIGRGCSERGGGCTAEVEKSQGFSRFGDKNAAVNYYHN
jgi:hypothetical protein